MLSGQSERVAAERAAVAAVVVVGRVGEDRRDVVGDRDIRGIRVTAVGDRDLVVEDVAGVGFSALRSGAASTVVSVAQSGSSLPAAQLLPGPVTTTTFGRSVWPAGKLSSSVTEKVSVTEPPAAIVGIVQVSVSLPNEQVLLQSAL